MPIVNPIVLASEANTPVFFVEQEGISSSSDVHLSSAPTHATYYVVDVTFLPPFLLPIPLD